MILEDGSTIIIFVLSQLTRSLTFSVSSCRMLSTSTSWSVDSAMSTRSSAKSASEGLRSPNLSGNDDLEVVLRHDEVYVRNAVDLDGVS